MYEILSQIFGKFIPFPVLALGTIASAAWVRRAIRLRLFIYWWWYIVLALIIALTYFGCWKVERNAREWTDLKVTLNVSSGARDFDEISIEYENQSALTMEVSGVTYRIDGSEGMASNAKPIIMEPGTKRSKTLGVIQYPDIQRLAIVNVYFQFADGFLSKDTNRIVQCQFSLAPGGASGKSIIASDCKELDEADSFASSYVSLNKALALPAAGFDTTIPEDNDPKAYFLAGSPPGWVFKYLPAAKKAYLVRGWPGRQIGAATNVGETIDGKHRFEGYWNNSSRTVVLTVDGKPLGYVIPPDAWKLWAAE